jgi:hypothetical protein
MTLPGVVPVTLDVTQPQQVRRGPLRMGPWPPGSSPRAARGSRLAARGSRLALGG